MIKINLLPGKAKKDLLKIDIYLFIFVMIINLLIFGGIYYVNARDISNYKNKIEDMRREISSLQNIYKEYLAMEQEKKEIQRRIKAIDGIKEGRALSARILYDLTSLIKDNVWLTSFKKTNDKFELDGHSLENESISALVENLLKIPYIKNVELKNISDTTEQGITIKKFIISGDLIL
jgi:type IV pilus assembly protein PilN